MNQYFRGKGYYGGPGNTYLGNDHINMMLNEKTGKKYNFKTYSNKAEINKTLIDATKSTDSKLIIMKVKSTQGAVHFVAVKSIIYEYVKKKITKDDGTEVVVEELVVHGYETVNSNNAGSSFYTKSKYLPGEVVNITVFSEEKKKKKTNDDTSTSTTPPAESSTPTTNTTPPATSSTPTTDTTPPTTEEETTS